MPTTDKPLRKPRRKKSPPVGRPRLLTPETHSLIIETLSKGNTRPTAAALADIHYITLQSWLKRGNDAQALEDTGETVREDERPFIAFSLAVKKAEAEAHALHVQRIIAASQSAKHWTASAWFLERKFPEQWGRRDRVEHDTKDGKPLQVEHTQKLDLTNLSVEDLMRLREIALRARGQGAKIIDAPSALIETEVT